ncbi:MAG: DNA-directed DNA polymerase, partial [Patescibacteria group bacterium]|nr:DNA-directed DNA polymerase [Patescibacteria group bacterium]
MSECILKKLGIKPVVGYDDKDDIIFYYHDKETGKKVGKVISNFPWYFCVKTSDLTPDTRSILNRNMFLKDRYGRQITDEYGRKQKIKARTEEDGTFTRIYCKRFESYSIRDTLKKLNVITYEADLTMTKRYMIDNMVDIEEDLSVLFFDIETDDSNGGIVIGRDRILSWAGCDGNTGKTYYFSSGDEKEVVYKLLKLLSKYDLILGWNSKQFDIPYIKERVKVINSRIMAEGGSLKDCLPDEKHALWKKTIHVDMMQRLIKLFGPMMSIVGLTGFSLNEVSRVFLGDAKIEREERVIDLYNDNPEKLKEYNIKDVELLHKLNQKLRTLPLMIKECFWTGTFMDRFYIGELLDNYILRGAGQKNFHVRTRPEWNENDESLQIRGGYVMEPKTGLYDNVRTLDFKSMYPSIIVGWNVGQESLVEGDISEEALKDFDEWLDGRKLELVPFMEWNNFLKRENDKLNPGNKYIQAGNNQFFRREQQSIIAGLIQKLLVERKQYKKMQLDAEYKSVEYNNAQASQEAVKEMSNSMYGITADKQSRYFDPRIAEAITVTGQLLNRSTMHILEKMGYPVIYGDTDSIFTYMDGDEEMVKVTEQLNIKLSKYLTKRFKVQGDIIFLEYEKKFRKFLMLDKKRYSGHMTLIDDKKVDNMLSKGTENVRKSTIEYSRQKVDECLRLITKKDKDAKYMKAWVKKIKAEVLNEDIAPEDLAITMKLSKPISQYKSKPPHVRLAERLIKENKILETQQGKHVWGQKIEYIIVDSKDKDAIILADEFEGVWDRKYYWDVQVYAPLMRILKGAW